MDLKHKILIVEDDSAIRNLVATALDLHGYLHKQVGTGALALLELSSNRYDLLLLDLGLPDMDGTEIIEKLRGWSDIPVIVVSARLEDKDKIAALDAGADDYLVKPFSVEELLARLRVWIRRIKHVGDYEDGEPTEYVNGELRIDYVKQVVTLRGEEVHLTPYEYKLLCLFAKNTGKVLTHTYILKSIWGNEAESAVSSLRVFMVALRRKIEDDPADPVYIKTHVGVGYRMVQADDGSFEGRRG